MILYKFKSLRNFEHVFDILHNERLFCTKYSNLNDPFEGLFLATMHLPSLSGLSYIAFMSAIAGGNYTGKYKVSKKVEDLYYQLEHIKICSLSDNFNDVRLWSHYADGYKGIAIAIDFPDTESVLHKVKYSAELPEFSDTILCAPSPPEVLSRKTNHWEYEAEYRIIQDKDYHSVKGRIKTIYAGQRITECHAEMLKKIIPQGVSMYMTKLNTEKVKIEQDKSL